WNVVQTVGLLNVICVIFVTHVYETVFLVKERARDLVLVERLERARAEAELLALKRQVDPHFLFNCLNTLQHLIGEAPERALEFNQDLAMVLRYVVRTAERPLVSLREELTFVEHYTALLRI